MSAFTEHEQLDDKIFGEDGTGYGAPTHTSSIFDNPFRENSIYWNIARDSQGPIFQPDEKKGKRATADTFAHGSRVDHDEKGIGGVDSEDEANEAIQTNPTKKEKFIIHITRWWWAYLILGIIIQAVILPIL